jgi:hypothetical protein
LKSINDSEYENQKINQIITTSDDTLFFNDNECQITEITQDSVKYISANSERITLHRSDIEQFKVEEYSASKTSGAIISGTFVLLGLLFFSFVFLGGT